MERTPTLAIALFAFVHAQAQIVINEVDYDQVSTDTEEYVEIKNIGTSLFPLQYLSVIMYNGSTGSAVEYRNIQNPSWPPLDPGAYFVICTNASSTTACNEVATPATNLVQNGPGDAIALVLNGNPTQLVIDVVSYGGSLGGFVEGSGTVAEDTNDSPGVSIGRFPDGQDTQDNNADFHLMCSTPGAANIIDPVQCDLSTGVRAAVAVSSTFAVLTAPGGDHLMVYDGNPMAEPLTYEVLDVDGSLLMIKTMGSTVRASWSVDVSSVRGRMLLVRLTTPTRSEARRVVLP